MASSVLGHPGWHFWLIGFGMTLGMELPVVLWLLRRAEPRFGRRLANCIFANLVTHPLVWFFFPDVPTVRWLSLTLSECWAFGAEAVFYWLTISQLTFMRATLVSCAANTISLLFGWLIVRNFGPLLFRL